MNERAEHEVGAAGGAGGADDPARARRRWLRVGVQLIGVLAALGSLAWCVSLALRPENEEQFRKLVDAPPTLMLGMLGLSLATLVMNGMLFWIALAPVRRLGIPDIVATNFVSTFLAYLPLKAGAVVRVLIHNRRDRVPLLLIGAWFAVVAGVMAAAITPLVVAMLVRTEIDAAWVGLVAAMEVAMGAGIVLAAGAFKGVRGVERLSRLAGALRLRMLQRLLGSGLWRNIHPGFDMAASPWGTGGGIALRLADAGVHTARFMVAATILGVELPVESALPIGLTYFLVGALNPAGLVGLREGAATGLAGLLLKEAGVDAGAFTVFAPVALLVTATEAIVYTGAAALGLAWLRPDRLLKLRRADGA